MGRDADGQLTGVCYERADYQPDGIHPAAGARVKIATMIHEQLHVHSPVMAAVRRVAALGGGLKAGVGTIADRGEPAHASFRALATTCMAMDLDQLRGQARVQHERTMPLWIQRDFEATGT